MRKSSLLFIGLLFQVEIFTYKKIRKVVRRQHDPYRLHIVYRNDRPVLANTKEWFVYEDKKAKDRSLFQF